MHDKVAVLGGGGFLGAHVVQAFARKGYEVERCSRTTGVDARDERALQAYLRRVQPDMLINCTHHGGGIAYNARNPVAIFEDNLLTGFNALRAAAKSGVRKLVNVMGNSTYPGALDLHEESAWWNGALHPSVISSSMPRKASAAERSEIPSNRATAVLPLITGLISALANTILRAVEVARDRAPATDDPNRTQRLRCPDSTRSANTASLALCDTLHVL